MGVCSAGRAAATVIALLPQLTVALLQTPRALWDTLLQSKDKMVAVMNLLAAMSHPDELVATAGMGLASHGGLVKDCANQVCVNAPGVTGTIVSLTSA